ncbi:unnamed protein product [Echinostoma caproni]|uniref:Transcription factor GAMYB n=1 Tax=Echinostoma caproni TaxID=27848 RepID=A0A183A544_9TREM|nr:unnamed protein product [Echinostoma caproni]
MNVSALTRPDQHVIFLPDHPHSYDSQPFQQQQQQHQSLSIQPHPQHQQPLQSLEPCSNYSTVPVNHSPPFESHAMGREAAWTTRLPSVNDILTTIQTPDSMVNGLEPVLFNVACYPTEPSVDSSKLSVCCTTNEWALDELVFCSSASPNTTTITTTTSSTLIDTDGPNPDGTESTLAVDAIGPWDTFDRDMSMFPTSEAAESETEQVTTYLDHSGKPNETCPFESMQLIQECLKSESLVSAIHLPSP